MDSSGGLEIHEMMVETQGALVEMVAFFLSQWKEESMSGSVVGAHATEN